MILRLFLASPMFPRQPAPRPGSQGPFQRLGPPAAQTPDDEQQPGHGQDRHRNSSADPTGEPRPVWFRARTASHEPGGGYGIGSSFGLRSQRRS